MKNLSKLSALFVNNLNISFKKYDTAEIGRSYPDLNGIKFAWQKDLDVKISNGTDHADIFFTGIFVLWRINGS